MLKHDINEEENTFQQYIRRALTNKEKRQKHLLKHQMDKRCLYFQGLVVILGLVFLSGLGRAAEESKDVVKNNRTDSLLKNGSVGEPRVLGLKKKCAPEDDSYCLNGVCSYLPELNATMCRCHEKYSGERCEFVLMYNRHSPFSAEKIAAIFGVILLMGMVTVMLFFLKKRCEKTVPYKKEVQESSV